MTKKISKKNLLHDEVQSRISKMLMNKNVMYQNKPVDNTETNARLIKSFLYRKISSKYPKYNSFSKISTINNLDDNELSNLLLDLPNLDEWYATIQQSVEKKKLEKKNQPHVSDEKDVNYVVDEVVENVNSTVENVNIVNENSKLNTDVDEFTSNESNQLNENFNLTSTIITVVRKIVIVYAFYRLARWFV